ncbi:16S rRNA (guanine(966)-N(2))-methyltransferase RsmD [Sphingomonas sabuli]|uniref:16S rRNA (Guanine(966)-N(2))-methyltransferase RsmD n=1 Tax=Sphingomonas sabuli TaxID=2764186 RepID=A0A7G9L3E9_9SPHN|nr:16S rRNA (guanine(966)-N(2))-methyltransferase RsmD [Sphingomonas sabuli]QNM83148.1 16S rRNA (guanine(966)-N(2))-methyltransferase RsmD [Sphingomonas sabuli]
MRIISGQWRGRKLVAPEGQATRPTSDRVRETLFSMLVSRLGDFDGLRVADLYAGSGAYGLEALSRGATLACFVEQEARAIAAIRTNLGVLGASEQARIMARSAAVLPREEPFDLILADPPYAPGSGSSVIAVLRDSGWAAPAAWIAVETKRGDRVDAGDWAIDAERDVGPARLTLIRAGRSSPN